MVKDDLRSWVEKNGYTYRDLASQIGITTDCLKKWIYGERQIPRWLDYVIAYLDMQRQMMETNSDQLSKSRGRIRGN
jgi:hypothetical protein